MFEKLVETILVEYVSEWVDGLDSEKMKIALFGGKVEFRELKLKTSSLDKFHLPLTVKAGTLGRLSMKVPWKRLTKEAVTIHIEDLYLLVVPAHEEELHRQRMQQQKSSSKATAASKEEEEEEDSYALRIRWTKQQEVRMRELLEKNKTEDAPSASGDNSSGDTTASWGYREKILHNIMDNVSFEFSKIHIRYEDTTQLLTKNPLALGVTIDSITVNTTNANGHVTFVDRAQSHTPFVHKILEMALAGFYCDDTSSVQDLVSARRHEPLASSYIIHPFNTNIKMTVNHDETTAFSIPKFQFVGDIGSINASVTPDQCNDLISVINFISTHELYLKRIHCRRKRPTVSVKRNAKKWWKYAFFGVQVMYSLSSRKLSGLAPGASSSALTRYNSPKPPCDWKLFGVLWKCQKEYIHLHKRMLRAAAKKLSVESVVAERCRLNELEDILDVDSIVFFRICAAQELELEEARHDSVKKLSNWKARWNSRSHSQDSDTAAGLRSLDALEKLVLYSTLSEQMHASSKALAAKERENSSSQTILFAIDVAISSIRLSLIEHYVYNSASTTGSTREFLQFELQEFVFAIFQRNGSSSISSSIKSIHMLDFSQVGDPLTGARLSQPLFYSLVLPNSTPVAVKTDQAESEKTNAGATKAVATPPLKLFLDLKIESSETKFKLDCSFEPFRYIHNLSVAAKLQTYFVAQVDVSPALKENAEDALAYSSEWLNNAVFAGTSAPSSSSNKPAKPGQPAASITPARTVEFSIRLPEVDILVLTTDTSPILQVQSVNLDFKSGNLLDTFLFSIEGVMILFYDGTHAHENESVSDLQQPHGVKLLRHQDGLKDIRRAPSHGAMKVNISDYDLTHRKYSTILRKTRLMFHGEKITEQNRPPKWSMKCAAPPIYFTLSSAQYRQVLQASASWGHSELELEAEENTTSSSSSSKSISRETVTSDGEPSKKLHRSTSSFVIKEFDDEDERFGLSIMIPQTLVVLEGEDRACSGTTGDDEQPPPVGNEQLAIDQCEVKIGSFQLDNQLENAMFPVIFTPIPSNSFSSINFIDSSHKLSRPMTPPTLQERKRSNADGEHTEDDDEERFLHISIFRLSYGDDVEYIKYFSAMLQPARLQIDDFLIISAASLFTDCMQVVLRHYPQNSSAESEPRTGNAGSNSAAVQRGSSALADGMVQAANTSEDASIAKIPPIERRMYIETLQLHPMKIHITFQQNNLSKATFFDDQATLLLPVVFMILKSNLVNIDCASLNLNALHIYHSFTTRAFMFSTIQQHYTFQGILQIYALVGAADILGNPIGLVTNLGTGVKDFFYEPVAGMVKSPQEFVLGLSRGTASLVKNSVYGTFNAASKFTGTLPSGIAALSMDSKYIKERNTRNRQEVPTHLGTGLLYGTKQLGQGILAGVSGVITGPAMGAYNNGLTGFVEGVGKGLIGVAIKPTAGILDLAARTTAGITATATVFDKKARNTRVRLPRMMHTSDKRLRVYSGDEAMISQLLHRLPQKLLQNEHYEAHVFLPLNRAVVATSHQFLHVDFSSIAAAAMGPSPPRITWKCPLTSLWGVQKTNRGVNIMIGTATNVQISPGLTTLVTKSSMSTVLVPLRETDTMFADRIVKCVAELVARQRECTTPTSESYAAPPPRNSIGLVLEPVRGSARVQGYEGSGGQVVDVFVGSACFRAGVEVGDIIVGFGGKKLERGDHGSALRYQLSLMKKGDTLELMILRNGETETIKVATE